MKPDGVSGQKQVAWDAGSSQKPEDGIVAVAASFEDFSVVVAARNAAATIQRTLWSIAAQTLSPREIVLVDDDSGDDTVAAAQRSGVAVHILRVAFRNAAAARNAGVRIAGGHWIAFLDADDEWYPAHLAGAANLLSKGGDIAFLAAADYVSVGAVTPPRPGPLMSQPRRNLRDQEFIELFRKSSWFCNCTLVVQKKRFEAVDGFDERLPRRHDLDLFLRLILGHTWAYSPTAAARIQLGNIGSISHDQVSCELYFLRSFTKLLPVYDSASFRAILRNRAYCALNAALMAGSPDDLQAAWKLGSRHIPRSKRALYGLARRIPTLAGRAARAWQASTSKNSRANNACRIT